MLFFSNLIAFVQRFENQMDQTRWLVTYDELPRDEEKFPGKSPEYYPDYIGDQLSIAFFTEPFQASSIYLYFTQTYPSKLAGSWW